MSEPITPTQDQLANAPVLPAKADATAQADTTVVTPKADDTAAPVVPTTPDKPKVSMDDFESLMDGSPTITFPGSVNADGKVINASAEDLLKTKTDIQVTPKADDSTTTTAAAKSNDAPEIPDGNRDFTGLEENEVPLFKRMSNPAFNYLKPALLKAKANDVKLKAMEAEVQQLKQGKQILPPNYYEHPDAYVLTPEVRETSEKLSQANSYANHWEKQLLAIEEGKDWFDLTTNAQGQVVIDPTPKPANAVAKMQVNKWYNGINNTVGQLQGRIESIKSTHLGRYQADTTKLADLNKQYFPIFDDEKVTPELKAAKDGIKNYLPDTFKNNPLAEGLARAATLAQYYQQMYMAEKTKNGNAPAVIAAAVAADQRKAGPNNTHINSGGNTSKPAVSVADFNKYMDGE